MVGGGQLARMTHQAAIPLGQTLRVLAVSPEDPAAQVSPDVVIGSHTDLDALRRAAAGASALTFDHEHVPTDLLHTLVAEGVAVLPPPEALVCAQDKLVMRERLSELGAPVPRFCAVTGVDDVDAFAGGEPCAVVVKTVRGGYDGRGVVLAEDLAEAREAVAGYLASGVPVMLEERVSMRRELAVLVARSPFGQGAAWPVVETVQRQGICVTVLAPAPGLCDEVAAQAEQLGPRIADELGVVGALAAGL
ncbi:MAG: 5-(carboxyamino)imidazole ribonucleotide synthase, partial [Mycobacterium sp.]|nr:5-(carboxyamino)imidazole ribonucleotide synthase [Mycobacterium sp.]